jgi:hypothetical protein
VAQVVLSYQTDYHSVTDLEAGFMGLLSGEIYTFDNGYFEIGNFDTMILNHPMNHLKGLFTRLFDCT